MRDVHGAGAGASCLDFRAPAGTRAGSKQVLPPTAGHSIGLGQCFNLVYKLPSSTHLCWHGCDDCSGNHPADAALGMICT